jgi:2-polyprenyl-3-methyl-5-hydroxy-6-metoxy-1,4-benzoquinol methylase
MKSHYTQLENGSYKSNYFHKPEDIYFNDYWSPNMNHSTIHQQVGNVVEKNVLVKNVLTKIEPKKVLEIACAPGILLGDLSEEFKCTGIEIDERYKNDIQGLSKDSDLHFGFFPEVTGNWESEQFSNIIALDVIEHIEDGKGFLEECYRLLVNGGRLIIQAPMILEDGIMEERMFHEIEHIWIYDIQHMKHMLVEAGFIPISVERWKVGHEQIVAEK